LCLEKRRGRAFNPTFNVRGIKERSMSVDRKGAIERMRTRLDSGERGGCERDRELLLDFSDELRIRREDYGHARHEKVLRHLIRMSENAEVCLHETLLTEQANDSEESFNACEDATKEVISWIHSTYDIEDGSQETNRDYRVALRIFAKHLTRGEDVPDTHDWVSTRTTRDYDPSPDEADMLLWERDVLPMIEACKNPRDKALLAVQFEGGFRGGELYDIQKKDVYDSAHSTKIRVDGKRGEHDVHLIMAVPYLNRWLAEHPGGRDDYLWTKLSTPDRFSYQRFLQCFKEAARRVDIKKPVTPTNFRKSNAYWLSRQDKSQAFIEDRQGRVRGSKAIARYIAAFAGETQETEYAAMMGADVEQEERSAEEFSPVVCPRCSEETPREGDFCIHCNQALDLEAKQLLDQVADTLDDQAIRAENPDKRAKILEARRALQDKPATVGSDELHEFVSDLVESL